MIIGLSGASKSGKSTAMEIIKDLLPDCVPTMFAYYLKFFHAMITNCSMEDLEKQEFKESYIGPNWVDSKGLPITHRQLLEHTANRLRDLCPDIWVNGHKSRVDGSTTVFTDVRYRNEAKFIKSQGGVIIRLKRDSENTNLESNKELDFITADYIIHNNSTVQDLEENIKSILTELKLI